MKNDTVNKQEKNFRRNVFLLKRFDGGIRLIERFPPTIPSAIGKILATVNARVEDFTKITNRTTTTTTILYYYNDVCVCVSNLCWIRAISFGFWEVCPSKISDPRTSWPATSSDTCTWAIRLAFPTCSKRPPPVDSSPGGPPPPPRRVRDAVPPPPSYRRRHYRNRSRVRRRHSSLPSAVRGARRHHGYSFHYRLPIFNHMSSAQTCREKSRGDFYQFFSDGRAAREKTTVSPSPRPADEFSK